MEAIRKPLGRSVPLAFLVLCLGCSSLQGARLYSSGTEALDRGDPERAVTDLEAAARLLPEASEIQNHLGLAYAGAGRGEDAVAAFRRAVELDCDNGAAAHNLRAAQAGQLWPPEDAHGR